LLPGFFEKKKTFSGRASRHQLDPKHEGLAGTRARFNRLLSKAPGKKIQPRGMLSLCFAPSFFRGENAFSAPVWVGLKASNQASNTFFVFLILV
jgi:hypothetical protein